MNRTFLRKQKEARKAYEGALYANTAFKNLLDRNATKDDVISLVSNPAFDTVRSGVTRFQLEHAIW